MHDIDRNQLEQEAGTPFELERAAPAPSASRGATSPFDEMQEFELATELLEVASEGELEQFLGKLLSRATRAAGAFVRSPTGKALGGILKGAVKDVAKKALPVLGQGLGSYVAGGAGGKAGGALGAAAGQLLGLELEGLSQEDREFETARQLVRFAGAAARQAAVAPAGSPRESARRAVAAAARAFAPGLLPRLPGSALAWPHAGRWVRRGRTIVIYG